ncbi:uroporphyrinogen-III synthase [Hoeflea sp.]|uniref:uroporphyrinogen-III synthase n=1 Tax=Hoeflea sp. TaxID=1940281 RepID=UPI002AFFBD46|nr:uroporphyrinogen-III synthase [Hoeflea sp.]
MRVLLTRPEPGATQTAVRLEALGHEAVKMPLYEAAVTARIEDLPQAVAIRGLIATSARAFTLFGDAGALPEGYARLPVHVVGPATAAAARAGGFSEICEGAGTAADLAETLAGTVLAGPETPDRAGLAKPWLYLAGAPRTTVIEDAMAVAKAPVRVIQAYQMTEISYPTDIDILALLSPSPDTVVLYSPNAARRFSSLITSKDLGKFVESTRFMCLSPAISMTLPQAWQARALAADHPDEDSLLASLARLG